MQRINWQVKFSVSLIVLSSFLYYLHFLIFHDARHIFIYLLGDIAYVPLEVLLVTLIIHQLLNAREKRVMMKKLNMVIGVFFSEVGTGMLKYLTEGNAHAGDICAVLKIEKTWDHNDFRSAQRSIKGPLSSVEIARIDLSTLRSYLLERRGFLLSLLENPNLLEHESFTDMLWAVFHLSEELANRSNFHGLPAIDYEHINGDINRAYGCVISEWLSYMEHLNTDYPYLFSLALRMNPFDRNASVVLK
jgi:hypothetical protein